MSPEPEFDHVAPVYDETRRPPSEGELDILVRLLDGCHTLVDGGVGTGRFAAPLRARGFEVVGIDLSLAMMRRAAGKGIARLVRANLQRLPLRDDAVDAAFTAHVLQLVPDPTVVLRELGRVARHNVVVLLPERPSSSPSDARGEFYRRYRAIAKELGYSLPERGPRYWHRFEELRAIASPLEVVVVEGQPPALTEEAFRRQRDPTSWFGERAVPKEIHAEILRRIEAERPTEAERLRVPRVERFIVWSSSELRRPK